MSEKKLYNIFHVYDVDGGFGDAVRITELIGSVWATEEEIDGFLSEWDKPIVYERPFAELTCHGISVQEANLVDLDSFVPYEYDEGPYGYPIRDDLLERQEEA